MAEQPEHLSNHHRNTLRQIFQHPVSHNIEWRSVLSLLDAVGSVEENHDGKAAITLGSSIGILRSARRRDKDIDAQMVVDLRRMLTSAGYGPDGHEG